MDLLILFITLLILLIIIYLIYTYNLLITRKNIVKDQFSQIDVQLKRRNDLIPNLVEIVEGYSKYEKETFTKIVEARNKFTTTNDINDEIKVSNEINTLLKKIFVLAEAYPELKSNQNYLKLQEDLVKTEDKIAIERQFYNDTILTYNNLTEKFPSNIIAKLFRFKKMDYLEFEALK